MKSGIKQPEVLDLSRGQYRRQYAGYVRGRRINAVSLNAEAWFWRLNVTFDDFGNGQGDPVLLHADTVGRRPGVTVDDVAGWVGELDRERLVARYEVGNDTYLHIFGFLELQPAGRNGKRVHRVPASPWDGGGNGPADLDGVNPGDSGCIQTNPGERGSSCAHHYQNHNQSTSTAPARAGGEKVEGFPIPCKTEDGSSSTWLLAADDERIADWQSRYPNLDIHGEIMNACQRIRDGGMPRKFPGDTSGLLNFFPRVKVRKENSDPSQSGHQPRESKGQVKKRSMLAALNETGVAS